MTWRTDREHTGHGFTLVFQPNYPEIELTLGTPMIRGAGGFRVVPVYHGEVTKNPISEHAATEWGGASMGPASPADGSLEYQSG